ncbi:type II secretion system protein J [Candidatus Omnitrophota bacterium]
MRQRLKDQGARQKQFLSRGFTIAEILITVLIFVVVSGMVMMAAGTTSQCCFQEIITSELQQKANRAVNILSAELVNAKPDGSGKLAFSHDGNNNCVITAMLPSDADNNGSMWLLTCDERNNCDHVVEYNESEPLWRYSVDSETGQLQRIKSDGKTQVISDNIAAFTCEASDDAVDNNQYDDGETLFLTVSLSKELPRTQQIVSTEVHDSVWLTNSRGGL